MRQSVVTLLYLAYGTWYRTYSSSLGYGSLYSRLIVRRARIDVGYYFFVEVTRERAVQVSALFRRRVDRISRSLYLELHC